jgi:hypothetical protein
MGRLKPHQWMRLQLINRHVSLVPWHSIQIEQTQYSELGTDSPAWSQRDAVKHIRQLVGVNNGRGTSRTQIAKISTQYKFVSQPLPAAGGYLIRTILLYQSLPALRAVVWWLICPVKKHLAF